MCEFRDEFDFLPDFREIGRVKHWGTFLYQILTKYFTYCGQYGCKLLCTRKYDYQCPDSSLTVKNACTVWCENPTDRLVVVAGHKKDGCGLTKGVFSYFVNIMPKIVPRFWIFTTNSALFGGTKCSPLQVIDRTFSYMLVAADVLEQWS
jgi:hypothetical protein